MSGQFRMTVCLDKPILNLKIVSYSLSNSLVSICQYTSKIAAALSCRMSGQFRMRICYIS